MSSIKVGAVTVNVSEHNSLETLVGVTKETNRNVCCVTLTQIISGKVTIRIQFVHYHRIDLQ
jgi:hypothetical protein